MGKHKGKRISVTIGDELHARLARIASTRGFSSVSELAHASLSLVADSVERASVAERPAEVDETDELDDIAEMFVVYSNYESPMYGERNRRRPIRRGYGEG